MDNRINKMTEKIIKKYEEDGNAVSLEEEDKIMLKNTPGSSSTSQTKGKWLTVQCVTPRTPIAFTGEGLTESRKSKLPNDQGAC